MYYVYLIVEKTTKDRYIGFTADLRSRLKSHNSGSGGKFTAGGIWELVYYEAYLNKKDATNREYRLKQDGRSRRLLYERTANSLVGRK